MNCEAITLFREVIASLFVCFLTVVGPYVSSHWFAQKRGLALGSLVFKKVGLFMVGFLPLIKQVPQLLPMEVGGFSTTSTHIQ